MQADQLISKNIFMIGLVQKVVEDLKVASTAKGISSNVEEDRQSVLVPLHHSARQQHQHRQLSASMVKSLGATRHYIV